jgi:uridylate kinase
MADARNYKRILVKLSGEALMGAADYGVDPLGAAAHRRRDRKSCRRWQVQVAVVDRRRQHLPRRGPRALRGMDRVTADHMGMLATVMNRAGDAGRARGAAARMRA